MPAPNLAARSVIHQTAVPDGTNCDNFKVLFPLFLLARATFPAGEGFRTPSFGQTERNIDLCHRGNKKAKEKVDYTFPFCQFFERKRVQARNLCKKIDISGGLC